MDFEYTDLFEMSPDCKRVHDALVEGLSWSGKMADIYMKRVNRENLAQVTTNMAHWTLFKWLQKWANDVAGVYVSGCRSPLHTGYNEKQVIPGHLLLTFKSKADGAKFKMFWPAE